MDRQPHQRFCTTCGQPLSPGTAFCVSCGAPVNASPPTDVPGQFPALAAGAVANRVGMGQSPTPRVRRRGSRLRGCGCLLLVLALLAGPFIGVALTTGRLHMIFIYIAGGMVALLILFVLIGMLATRSGREALAEGLGEGCLDAIFGGLLGG